MHIYNIFTFNLLKVQERQPNIFGRGAYERIASLVWLIICKIGGYLLVGVALCHKTKPKITRQNNFMMFETLQMRNSASDTCSAVSSPCRKYLWLPSSRVDPVEDVQ